MPPDTQAAGRVAHDGGASVVTVARLQRRRPYRWPVAAPGWDALREAGIPRQRWLRYWIGDTARGLGDLALHQALRLVPIDVCSALGGWLGRRAGRRSQQAKSARARALLHSLHPALDDDALDRLINDMWEGIGRSYAEFSVLDRLIPAGRVTVEGRDVIAAARTSGRPVITVGVHLGNWELIGPVMAAEGLAPTAITQPPISRFRYAIACASRGRAGMASLAPGRAGAVIAMRLLKRGGCLAMGLDEYIDGVVYGPVPGRPLRPAGNIVYAARLALATGAVLLPAWCLRAGGAHFRVTVHPAIRFDRPPRGRTTESAVLEAVHALDAVLRPVLTGNPEQWYMLHEVRPVS